MNREYILSVPQREVLNTFVLSTKYPVKELQEATWILRASENYDPFGKIWLDTLDYEEHEFEIIPNEENYKLIIYTNE